MADNESPRRAVRAAARARLSALDVDVLLSHVLGISRETLYAHPEVPLTAEELARFGALVARRERGEPAAYLIGRREFFGLDFTVDSRVLVPRPETENLVEAVLEYVRRTGATRVADIGTGSGAIGIALAVSEPSLRVIATDLSAEALAVARQNAERHGLLGRLELRQGDLFAPLRGKTVQVVTANLPYLADDLLKKGLDDRRALRFEPRAALVSGIDGLDLIRRAAAALPAVLESPGAAFFELDPPQAALVASLLAPLGETRILKDLRGLERVAVVER